MYSREYDDRILNFEASGGLLNSSLVMQDQQTDSYWSIMTGSAIGGELSGTELQELPVSEKARWDDWRERHPETLVLSVRGEEHTPDAYRGYWEDPRGFRGQEAEDDRLDTKEPIYAFEFGGVAHAVPMTAVEGGKAFDLEGGPWIFLYREPGAELFVSTAAYLSRTGFEERDGTWIETGTGTRFDAESRRFTGGDVEPFVGVDTFWYTWSLNHEDVVLLE